MTVRIMQRPSSRNLCSLRALVGCCSLWWPIWRGWINANFAHCFYVSYVSRTPATLFPVKTTSGSFRLSGPTRVLSNRSQKNEHKLVLLFYRFVCYFFTKPPDTVFRRCCWLVGFSMELSEIMFVSVRTTMPADTTVSSKQCPHVGKSLGVPVCICTATNCALRVYRLRVGLPHLRGCESHLRTPRRV